MKEETKYGKHNQPLQWYQKKLIEYLKTNNPDKLKFNPKILEIKNEQIIFGMEKHHGRLTISLKTLDDYHTEKMKKVYARLFYESQLWGELLEDDE